MRGNTNYQVQQVYASIQAIGQSKHEAKSDARSDGAKTWAEVGTKIKIYSYSTGDSYRDTWRHVLEHAKTEYGVKDIERLNSQHVQSYLGTKIDQGIARATFDQYAAACCKLEQALNRFAEQNQTNNQYKFELKDVRTLGVKELGARGHEPRAYSNPALLLPHLMGQHQLAATLQLESGARVKEISHINEGQLKGLQANRITGEVRGRVEVVGKGGKVRELQVSQSTYAGIKTAIAAAGGVFRLEEYKVYLDNLKDAAERSGQDYNGTHGLRWNYAQDRMRELQTHGLTYEEALREVSQEMGHERSDITEHYLK
jgi:hypothetical protein